jgi:hypothetical protein
VGRRGGKRPPYGMDSVGRRFKSAIRIGVHTRESITEDFCEFAAHAGDDLEPFVGRYVVGHSARRFDRREAGLLERQGYLSGIDPHGRVVGRFL